jgi:ubiquinone/menaquinone biosynthesis C-methylase UbiE
MLAGRFPGASVLGLDSSAAFLATAGCGGDERLEFVQHDVTTMPFPGAPAAVIYARFLLAHLTEPQTLIAAWAGELAHGGGLVLEEVEWIHTTDEVFSEYLDLMAGVLRARHTELYIGPMLGRCEVPACTRRITTSPSSSRRLREQRACSRSTSPRPATTRRLSGSTPRRN